ncbi:MAG: hypothetical protein ABIT37_23120 [Luteolibacter sp.]
MTCRFRLLFCLSLLLVSCDKPPEKRGTGEPEAKSKAPPAVTKSTRDPSPEARKKVRDSLNEANRISSPEERATAVAAIVWDNLELDPKLAADAFQQLTPGSPERVRLVQHLAMRLAEEDADAAIKWADALGNPDEVSFAYGKIALVIAEADPERAANLLSESGIEGREFDVALVQVIQRWAASKPADAAAWVVLFDPGEARTASINTVVSLWAKSDAPAAFGWIGTLQNDALREEARQAMAEAILQQTPSVQNEWIKLASPEIRDAFEKLKQQADKDAE